MKRLSARALGGLLGAAVLASCAGSAPEEVPSATAERGEIERIVVATGTIEPEREVEVRPRISGIVEQIQVEPGDMVTKGQPLLEIDKELIEVRAREAEARLEGSRVDYNYAVTSLERAVALHERGAKPEEELDAVRSQHDRARAAVARDRAGLDALRVQLRHATVVAPQDGKILDVYVEEGSAVSAVTAPTGGSQLLALAATDRLHLKGLVDENEISRVVIGQPARIRTEAFGDRVFQAEVREIAPIGQRRQNVTYFEVEVEITDPDASLLRPRMSGDAEIVTEVVEDAVLIPETALLYDGARIYVETVNNGDESTAARRDIEIGIIEDSVVQVLSGLEPGEEIRVH